MRLTGTPPAYLINRMPSHEVRTIACTGNAPQTATFSSDCHCITSTLVLSLNACMCLEAAEVPMPVCCCRMLIFGINSHSILWIENTSYRLTCRNDVTFILGFYEFSAQEAVLSSGFCACGSGMLPSVDLQLQV